MERRGADLVVAHAAQLVTVAGFSDRPKRGAELSELGMIADGAVAITGGRIAAVGPTEAVLREVGVDDGTRVIDASGRLVLPGLVDPHTHLIFAGSREYELAMKLAGASYMEIHARGGGILDTVRSTRDASLETLVAAGKKYLGQMLEQGTTTVEAKSGYGLNEPDEIKMLEAIRLLAAIQPVRLVATYLGAHAVPDEYRDDPEGYLYLITDRVLPRVAGEHLAEFCDVFTEEGVFSIESSRRILERARRLGFRLKIHADEIAALGGAELAAEMGAISADHLMMISEQGIRDLAASGTVAVLLPATTFCLMGDRYAPAREMISGNVAISLASDFNPGSCPVNSLQVVMGIACRQMKLQPAEVISAVTINAAHAIGLGGEVGSLEVGKAGDLVIFDAPNYDYLLYRFGTNLVEKVVKAGRVVVE
jgi:imidazolonepropionase